MFSRPLISVTSSHTWPQAAWLGLSRLWPSNQTSSPAPTWPLPSHVAAVADGEVGCVPTWRVGSERAAGGDELVGGEARRPIPVTVLSPGGPAQFSAERNLGVGQWV